ncbi:hypothetical protein [Massilia sp. 9I]|uniref:hypothetical protein n=1 Tax=Massilia sp. 9I TaxID=2653152 RepID=UPI0012F39E24|nr:hypothetical protein [Massilia sp. 9I]VXB78752.1 conserved membrane hypothetical protein [Massilia sp. 9I]
MGSVPDRLRYLRSREALATLILPLVIVWKWWHTAGEPAWDLRVPALLMLVLILVQGTLYWHLKLRSITRQRPLPSWFYPLFLTFKWANLAGIGILLAVLLTAGGADTSDADRAWTAGMLAGAVLEQINYYYYQLMIDTRAAFDYVRRNRRLRRAALGLDLVRARPVR